MRSVQIVIVLCFAFLLGACESLRPLPSGLSYLSTPKPATDLTFSSDITYVDQRGQRQVHQEIFDHWFSLINKAQRFILIDMFLYNDFQGPMPEYHRALAQELTDRLAIKKQQNPEMRIAVITDPVNILYGGVVSTHFEQLKGAGVEVHITDLTKLRDSNPSWSYFWRLFIKPFGNHTNGRFTSHIKHPPVTLRSFLSFLNFKANHRKVLIADDGADIVAMITSANAHDPSSAHTNISLSLRGPAAIDLLHTENAVLAFSGGRPFAIPNTKTKLSNHLTVQVATESRIRDQTLDEINSLQAGAKLDIAMFLISHRGIIKALKNAHKRGVIIRVLLDPNRSSLGLPRSGIPNRPVAVELDKAGIGIRWCVLNNEQCHSKFVFSQRTDGSVWMSVGSANLTRRSLNDYNLETNFIVVGKAHETVFVDANKWFEMLWKNSGNRPFSKPFIAKEHRSFLRRIWYLFAEASGWSTF